MRFEFEFLDMILGALDQRVIGIDLAKWKARNAVPYAEAVFVSFTKGVSLDYLLAGERSPRSVPGYLPSNIDPEFLRAILQNFVSAGILIIPKDRKADATLELAAKTIAAQYGRAEKVMAELIVSRGLKTMEGRSAAIVATELIASDLGRTESRPRTKKTGCAIGCAIAARLVLCIV